MEALSVILFGLIIGSFLNVVIVRLPRRENIVLPRSHCTACQALIAWYDNIPVLSYLLLHGRCRSCRRPISPQYPLVEAATALAFWLVWRQYGLSLHAAMAAFFVSLLLALGLIDLRHMILPDALTLGGASVFLVYAFFNPYLAWPDALASAAAVALVFGGLFFYYLKVRKVEGLGFGDVKMVAMLGLFLGHRGLIVCVLLASVLGMLVGVYLIACRGRTLKSALPFGTFLSLAGIVSLFLADGILDLLFRLTRSHA